MPLEMFRFATNDELYLAVMQIFGEANERLVTALTFDEVLIGLRGVGWYDPVPEGYSEARRSAAGTAQDFRTLARWFTACPTEQDAHRLFGANCGDSFSRSSIFT